MIKAIYFCGPFLHIPAGNLSPEEQMTTGTKVLTRLLLPSRIVDVVLPVHLRMTLVTTLYVAYKTQFFSDWFDSEAQGSLYPQTFRSGNMLPQLDGVKSPDPLVT